MDSTQKRQENIQVKLVKWYKSSFKVISQGEKVYEFERDQNNVPIRDHQGNIVLKKDEHGLPIPKENQFGEQIIKVLPTKVYENKIANTTAWMNQKYG